MSDPRLAIRYLGPRSSVESGTESAGSSSLPALTVLDTVSDLGGDLAGPDGAPPGPAGDPRPNLRTALERIAAGEASVLLVAHLADAARTLRELAGLLEWLQGLGADLMAEDVGLDTGSASGAATTAVLMEVASWERDPGPGGPRRGRPGLERLSPDLARRIASLREGGMSLQAIADVLNAESVPTPRGGAEWRPSSVQAALGYRRPRPPVPGGLPKPGPKGGPGRPGPGRGPEPGPKGGPGKPGPGRGPKPAPEGAPRKPGRGHGRGHGKP